MEDRAQTWQHLRALRSDPPGLARSGDRRRLFGAALEQAEQLLTGAERLGVATKPINIFYGLSQGVRAIAAVRVQENGGRLRGHGITHDGSLDRPLSSIKVRDSSEKHGSFTTIARAIGSPSLPAAVALGDLIAALPLSLPGVPSWTTRPRPLLIRHLPMNTAISSVLSSRIFAETYGWPMMPELQQGDRDSRRAWASMHLKNYPTLVDAEPIPEEHPWVRLGQYDDLGLVLKFELGPNGAVGSDRLRQEILYSRTEIAGDEHFAFPRFDLDAPSPHPLITLWACLWSFSMLARYEPVRWARLLDVDSSPDATALGEVLSDALNFVPWFLLAALKE